MPLPPSNPYIAGAALGGERGFFGREDIWSGKVPQSVVGGVGTLARQFVAEFLTQKDK